MTSPAPRLYVPNGVQMTLHLTQGGQKAAVVLGAIAAGGWGLEQASVNAWRDAAWSAFQPLMVGAVQCTGATARFVNTADAPVVEAGPPASPTGGAGTVAALASGCTLIKWATTRGGRSGKGRSYLPGLSQQRVNPDGRTYDATFGPVVNTAINTYLASAAFSDGTIRPAVLSFTKGSAARITGGSLAGIVGIQRRRMRG